MQQYPYHTADEQPSVFTNGSNAVLNAAESAQTGAQHRQPAICPTCSGQGSYPYRGPDGNTIQVQCAPCEGTGKQQAGA